MERRMTKLRELELFSDCSPDELATIDTLGSELVIPAGGRVIGQGHTAMDCLIIVDGTAIVSRDGAVVGTEGPGSILGEMALLRHLHRNATVTAATEVTAIVFDPAEFYELLRIPSARAKILRTADVQTIEPRAAENPRTPYLASVGW